MPIAEVTVKAVQTLWEKPDGSSAIHAIAGTYKKGEEQVGLPQVLKFWKNAQFFDAVKVDEVLKVEFEKKPSKNDPDKEEHWVTSVNGTPHDAPKPGRGGAGGNRPYTPKTPAEIHGPNIALIIAHLGTCEGIQPKDIKPYLDLYKSEIAGYGNATAGKVGAS